MTTKRTSKQLARDERRRTISARARLLAEQQTRDEGDFTWVIWVSVGLIVAMWGLGVAWLCVEQTRLARHLGFGFPYALPAIVDGAMFAAAMFATAVAMSGRSSSQARMFSVVINLVSAFTNGEGAHVRHANSLAVGLAAMVPVILMWLFHLVLAEIRLRVRIQRGLPAEVAPPALRVLRIIFAGKWAITEWRAAGFAITDPLPLLPLSVDDKSIVSELHNPAPERTRPAITAIPYAPQVVSSAVVNVSIGQAPQSLRDAPAPAPLPEYRPTPAESSPAPSGAMTTPSLPAPGRPGYWPLELQSDLADALAQRAINANAPVVAAIARRAIQDGLVTTSDLNGARKIVRRWLTNYESSMVITESE